MIILPNVFISYKSEEYADANKLRIALLNAGITCWMAPDDIPGGNNYAEEIPKAIQKSPIFLLVLSSAAQQSIHIESELGIARDQRRKIMPYMIEHCDLTNPFYYHLQGAQYYYAYEDESTALGKLVFDIKGYIENASRDSISDDNLRLSKLSIAHSEEEQVSRLLQEETKGNTSVCVKPANAVLLGKAYESGTQVAKDLSKAQYYYTAGAYYGNDEAKFLLARLNLKNRLNTDESQIQQIIEAADNGYDEACTYLGNLFYDGNYVEQSYEKAVSYWKKAEERNNAEAQYLLAFCYANEKGVPANYNLARMLAEQSNQQGYPRGARMLGHIYRDGLGCPQDLDKAEVYYKLAVERSDYASEVLLGNLYEDKKDYETSFIYYSLAADRGNATGMYYVAWAYRTGKGVSEDQEKAVEWFFRAIEAGHKRSKEDVSWSIQQIEDLDQRLQLNIRAFELGCYNVAVRLYWAYSCMVDYKNRGDLKDVEKAFYYVQKGAENDDPIAEVTLARAYSTVICNDRFDGKYNDSALTIEHCKKIINKRKKDKEQIRIYPYDYVECCLSYVCEEILHNTDYHLVEDEILDTASECLKYSNRFFKNLAILMRGLTGLEGEKCPTNHALAQKLFAILLYAAEHSEESKLESTSPEENVFDILINISEEILQQYAPHGLWDHKEENENILFWAENLLALCKKTTRDTTKQESYALFCCGEHFFFKSGFKEVSIPIPKSTLRIRAHRWKTKDDALLLKSTAYYVDAYSYGWEAAKERLNVIAQHAPVRLKKRLNWKYFNSMSEIEIQ